MECLNHFGETAGLHVNVLKSNIFMAGVSEEMQRELLEVTGYKTGTIPFRYLGIPLASRKLKMTDYGPLMEQLNRKINSWQKNSISRAGRLELIRSVLQGVQCYWMSILPIPGGVIKKINALCRNFFWNSNHPPVAWKTVCMPAEGGGLGLRNLYLWNKALLCKLLWNIHSKKDSLWIRWVNHYYSKDFWNYTPKRDDSPLIKSLIKLRNDLCLNGETHLIVNDRLKHWFQEDKAATDKAYRWFYHSQMHWPWKPLIFKQGILLKT